MEAYKTLVRELIEDHLSDNVPAYFETRRDALDALREDHDDVFGNMTGSRTCNTWEAQKFIDESGAIWDEDILDLFAGLGDDYFTETLKRGAETLDVVICELVADQVIEDMIDEEA